VKIPPELDRLVDVVLAYHPEKKARRKKTKRRRGAGLKRKREA
jgi:hypothetical protein